MEGADEAAEFGHEDAEEVPADAGSCNEEEAEDLLSLDVDGGDERRALKTLGFHLPSRREKEPGPFAVNSKDSDYELWRRLSSDRLSSRYVQRICLFGSCCPYGPMMCAWKVEPSKP